MKFVLIMSLMLTCLLTSCRSYTRAERFVNEVNSSGSSSSVRLSKDPTLQNDMIIVWDSATQQYYAIETWGNEHFFGSDENAYQFYLDNRIEVDKVENGYYRDASGHLYETSFASSKDLEKANAELDTIAIANSSTYLVNEFGLSQRRAIQVAKMSNYFAKQASSRTMTKEDYDLLGKDLLGYSLSSVNEAIEASIEGDDTMAKKLIDRAAETNGISPEHMEIILRDILL